MCLNVQVMALTPTHCNIYFTVMQKLFSCTDIDKVICNEFSVGRSVEAEKLNNVNTTTMILYSELCGVEEIIDIQLFFSCKIRINITFILNNISMRKHKTGKFISI